MGLPVAPESRPSPLPDRPGWTDTVDDYLRWRTADCKFAYYAAGPKICDGDNVHRDHLVAWAEAWDSGLAADQAERFYRDADNLWVMPGGQNIAKSDKDPADWKPDNPCVWRRYALDYQAIKDAYGLSVDRAEEAALAEMLGTSDTEGCAPSEDADTAPPAGTPAEPEPAPADLDEQLQEIRSTPCGQWGAEEQALARQAPAGFDWGRRDGNDDGVPCE